MQPIRTFVIRIYRRDRRAITGLVEDVRTGRSTSFSSVVELWTALLALLGRRRARARRAAEASVES